MKLRIHYLKIEIQNSVYRNFISKISAKTQLMSAKTQQNSAFLTTKLFIIIIHLNFQFTTFASDFHVLPKVDQK